MNLLGDVSSSPRVYCAAPPRGASPPSNVLQRSFCFGFCSLLGKIVKFSEDGGPSVMIYQEKKQKNVVVLCSLDHMETAVPNGFELKALLFLRASFYHLPHYSR